MYPTLLDMSESESNRMLRMLELDAYSGLMAVIRAQGPPDGDKLKLLKEVGSALHISNERHKAEVRKVALDERLNTIAYFQSGQSETSDEWVKEGRRTGALLARVAPQTVYTSLADEMADMASLNNEKLPLPANTERKRRATSPHATDGNRTGLHFRMPEPVKCDEGKKRKISFALENSTLAQHLMGPSKSSRITEYYRQKPKAKPKPPRPHQHHMKVRDEVDQQEYRPVSNRGYATMPMPLQHEYRATHHQQYHHQKLLHHVKPLQKLPPAPPPPLPPKINMLQNISIVPGRIKETVEVSSEIPQKPVILNPKSGPDSLQFSESPKSLSLSDSLRIVASKPAICVGNQDIPLQTHESFKVSDTVRVVPSKPVPLTEQKLIIVSSAQSVPTSSILQRTLTIPFVKNVSVNNLDKFKIVSTAASSLQLPAFCSASTTTMSNLAKHKVITLRTDAMAKKVIPLSRFQTLNAKNIKMVPIGGKILAKTAVTGTGAVPMYITMGNLQAATKSTTSTPIMVTARPLELNTTVLDETEQIVEEEKPAPEVEMNVISNDVLADILKASGVIEEDIETQITQLTAIPQAVPEKIMAEETRTEIIVQEDEEELAEDSHTYTVLEDGEDAENGQEVEVSEIGVMMSCEDFDDQHEVQLEADIQGRFEIEEEEEATGTMSDDGVQ